MGDYEGFENVSTLCSNQLVNGLSWTELFGPCIPHYLKWGTQLSSSGSVRQIISQQMHQVWSYHGRMHKKIILHENSLQTPPEMWDCHSALLYIWGMQHQDYKSWVFRGSSITKDLKQRQPEFSKGSRNASILFQFCTCLDRSWNA